MNAVSEFASALPRHVLVRLVRKLGCCADECTGPVAALRERVLCHCESDLVRFLNLLTRKDLDSIAEARKTDGTDRLTVGELRARLWVVGAESEAGGRAQLGTPWQPVPVLLGGKLAIMGDLGGDAPPATEFPRAIPISVPLPAQPEEPQSLEQLLEYATRLVGVRLGRRGRDKGAYGTRIASLLGVRELGFSEPDWRGEVEIKTIPVLRDRAGWWRVKEDPAVSMEHASPMAKLRRVLWVARVADHHASPVLSWYYQELSPAVRALVERTIHRRPKGAAGATTRGWYLHKSFFVQSGLLRSLNG